MRIVIQRVKRASVSVEEKVVGSIQKGFLVLIGVGQGDDEATADKYMKKITLKPGESVTEEIHLSPEAFMLYDEKGNFTLEKGAYDIFVGGCQPDARSAALTGNAPQKLTVTY